MRISIDFHGPFRVATGTARTGFDVVGDRSDPVPASSLKGVMRAAAHDLLGVEHPLVAQVFGGPGRPSPWSWTGAVMSPPPRPLARAQVAISADTGTAIEGALLVGEEMWADPRGHAHFSIDSIGWIDPASTSDHEAVLAAAARAVTSIGGSRRRGLGWVTLTPDPPAPSAAELAARVLAWRAGS